MGVIEAFAEAALCRDGLLLRSLAQEVVHQYPRLSSIPRPQTHDLHVLTMAAALVELLALRLEQPAPEWTREIGAMSEPFFLLEAVQRMPRLRSVCETESPEPLRRRQCYAPPDFLSFA